MLAGYDSESEASASSAPAPALKSKPSRPAPVLGQKRKIVIDYNVFAPTPIDLRAPPEEEIDEVQPALRPKPGLLSCLPPPKRTRPAQSIKIPGLDDAPAAIPQPPEPKDSEETEESEVESIKDKDGGSDAQPRCFFNLDAKELQDEEVHEEDEVIEIPVEVAATVPALEEPAAASIPQDLPELYGLSEREKLELQQCEQFVQVNGANLNDPNWYLKNAGKKQTATGILTDIFQPGKNQKVADPTQTQKRKHQINWLAQEHHEKGAEYMEKSAAGKLMQTDTSKKYGW